MRYQAGGPIEAYNNLFPQTPETTRVETPVRLLASYIPSSYLDSLYMPPPTFIPATDGGGNTTKSKSKDKIYERQMGGIQEMGYRLDSPYKSLPFIKINSNRISTKNMNVPMQTSEGVLEPNKEYYFPHTKSVLEMNPYQTGGDPIQQLFMAYFQANQFSQEQMQQFMQEFQGMSLEEQQQVVQYIQQELQGGEKQEMPQQEMQEVPQEQTGGFLRENDYYEYGGLQVPRSMFQAGGRKDEYIEPSYKFQNDTLGLESQMRGVPEVRNPLVETSTPKTEKENTFIQKARKKEAEKTLGTVQDIKAIQDYLMRFGHADLGSASNRSVADGIVGPRTRKAFDNYAKHQGITGGYEAIVKEIKGHLAEQGTPLQSNTKAIAETIVPVVNYPKVTRGFTVEDKTSRIGTNQVTSPEQYVQDLAGFGSLLMPWEGAAVGTVGKVVPQVARLGSVISKIGPTTSKYATELAEGVAKAFPKANKYDEFFENPTIAKEALKILEKSGKVAANTLRKIKMELSDFYKYRTGTPRSTTDYSKFFE